MSTRTHHPLLSLIDYLPFAANVLEVQTKHYILVNQHHALHHGFEQIKDALNIGVEQLFEKRAVRVTALGGILQYEKDYASAIREANSVVLNEKKELSFKVTTLSAAGKLTIRHLKKLPLLNALQQVHAIMTYAEDVTDQYSQLKLYQLYQTYYHDKVKANQRFLEHLSIASYFTQIPTPRELLTLLTMCENDTAKYIAAQLTIHPRTVEEYKARLRNKLYGISLEQLLILLRVSPSPALTQKIMV